MVLAERPYGLGCTEKQFRIMLAVCDAMTPTQERAAEAEHAIGKYGGDRKSEQYQGSNSYLDTVGRGADYWTKRIARDKPDIYADMIRGEYRSIKNRIILTRVRIIQQKMPT